MPKFTEKYEQLNQRQQELYNKMYGKNGNQAEVTFDNLKAYASLTTEKWREYYKDERTGKASFMPTDKSASDTKTDTIEIQRVLKYLFRTTNNDLIEKVFGKPFNPKKNVPEEKTDEIQNEKEIVFDPNKFYEIKKDKKGNILYDSNGKTVYEVKANFAYHNVLNYDKLFDFIEKNFSKEQIEKTVKKANERRVEEINSQTQDSERTASEAKMRSHMNSGLTMNKKFNSYVAKDFVERSNYIKESIDLESAEPDSDSFEDVQAFVRDNRSKLKDFGPGLMNTASGYCNLLQETAYVHNKRGFFQMLLHPIKYYRESRLMNELAEVSKRLGMPERYVEQAKNCNKAHPPIEATELIKAVDGNEKAPYDVKAYRELVEQFDAEEDKAIDEGRTYTRPEVNFVKKTDGYVIEVVNVDKQGNVKTEKVIKESNTTKAYEERANAKTAKKSANLDVIEEVDEKEVPEEVEAEDVKIEDEKDFNEMLNEDVSENNIEDVDVEPIEETEETIERESSL